MNKKLRLCLLITLLLLNSGCLNLQDINTKAYITTMGLDKIEITAGNPENPVPTQSFLYQLTAEIIKPASLIGPFSKEPASIIQTTEAETIEMALQRLQTKVPRAITLGHLRVLIIGDALAKNNFTDIVSFFEKNSEVARRLQIMFVQDGLAAKVLQFKPQLERYLAAELVAFAKLHPQLPLSRNSSFADLLCALRNNNGKALGSRLLTTNDGIINDGSVVFNRWRAIGWLNSEETKKANWLAGDTNAAVAGIMGPGRYTYYVDTKVIRLIPLINRGRFVGFKARLITDGIISQVQEGSLDLSKPKNVKKLENLFARVITHEVREAIFKAQQNLKVDYLGFGAALQRKHPKIFNRIKWDQTFPSIPIDLEIKAKITRIGLTR